MEAPVSGKLRTTCRRINIRYVLVGGLAVLLYGVDRPTADIDLVVDLAQEQACKAVETLLAMRFRANVEFLGSLIKRAAGRPKDLAAANRLAELYEDKK